MDLPIDYYEAHCKIDAEEAALEHVQSLDFNSREIAAIMYEFTSLEQLVWLQTASFQEILDALDCIQESYKW